MFILNFAYEFLDDIFHGNNAFCSAKFVCYNGHLNMLALEFAPRAVALVRGKVAYDGSSQALAADSGRLATLLGVGS